MCQFIESIAFKNGEFRNIEYHNSRFNYTINNFYANHKNQNLQNKIKLPNYLENNKLYKCRITYTNEIKNIVFDEYLPKTIHSVCLVEDNLMKYNFKFLNRDRINTHLKNSKADEILIVKNKEITDASFANVVFFDGINWYTPLNCLLNGTERQRLINLKIIKEKKIYTKDALKFSHFKFINALVNFNDSPLYSTTIIH